MNDHSRRAVAQLREAGTHLERAMGALVRGTDEVLNASDVHEGLSERVEQLEALVASQGDEIRQLKARLDGGRG